MFLHTFYTWILSNLLHPILFMLLLILKESSSGFFDFSSTVVFFTVSLVISLPCLFLGWMCLYLILNAPYSTGAKFIVWLATGPSLAFLEFLFMLLVINLMEIEILQFSFPGIAAVGISILIRYGQFGKLIYIPKIDNHETDLV